MALGGGIWAVQNKVLPGTYINFSSVAKASATLSDRGYAAMPLMLDWGPDSTVFTVTSGDFQKNSLKIFGHAYTDDALLPLRELFQYTQTLYAYRLNGGGAKAACAYCTAKYSGIAGNKLYVVIAANADNADLFDVSLYYDTTLLDTQTVAAATALKDNDFVTWKTTASLTTTAKTPLTGGTNGTANAAAHQAALDKFESYSFNIMNALDAIAGSQASAYVTMADGNRYCFMQLYSFESKMDISVAEVPILGKSGKGNKPTGWSGTWSGTAHYNQSVFREMLLEYKRTGFMPTFDIQVANEDPTASVGRQTIILKNCLTKGGILAKFDADAETLDEELEGTFDDWEMPETFSLLNGMQ